MLFIIVSREYATDVSFIYENKTSYSIFLSNTGCAVCDAYVIYYNV